MLLAPPPPPPLDLPPLPPLFSVRAMSSELLVDYGEDAATAQLGQLKLSTIEDQQWPADESHLSKSGETELF